MESIFYFHLRKTAAELYQLLREAYGEHVTSENTCGRWFRRFKSDDFDMRRERRQETRRIPKKSKIWNCKHCWTKKIRKHKNNSPSNWVLVNKLLSIGYEKWERFRRSVDGYQMS